MPRDLGIGPLSDEEAASGFALGVNCERAAYLRDISQRFSVPGVLGRHRHYNRRRTATDFRIRDGGRHDAALSPEGNLVSDLPAEAFTRMQDGDLGE